MNRILVAVTAVLALWAPAACGSADTDPTSSTTVELFGPFRGEEAELLARSLEPFTEATGIAVRYTGTGAFVTDLEAQVRAAAPPDIAFIPQPGLVRDLAAAGELVPLGEPTLAAIDTHYDEAAASLGEVDGTPVAVPFRASVKSLIWYRPSEFDRLELAVPADLAELVALVDQVTDQGIEPWCLGIEAQGATGWVATDWTEDLLLRLAGPDTYDGWIDGSVRFDDPAVAQAFEGFRALALDPGRSSGGIAGILETSTRDAAAALFDTPATCLLHRQGSIAWSWFPDGLEFGTDVDVFVFPTAQAGDEPPLVLGSTSAVAFSDRPEVEALMAHLATPGSVREWAEAGGFTSPQHNPGYELPPVDRVVQELLDTATVVRPDASDSMPAAIGTSLLWSEITAWVADTQSYVDFAATMDAAVDDLG